MEENLSMVEFHLLGLPSARLSIWHQLAYQLRPHSHPDSFRCCYDNWLPSCTQSTTSSLDFPTRLLKDRRQVLKNSYHYLVFANGQEGQAWGLSAVISAPGRLGPKNGQCEASLGRVRPWSQKQTKFLGMMTHSFNPSA